METRLWRLRRHTPRDARLSLRDTPCILYIKESQSMPDNARIARMKQKAWSMLDAKQPDEAIAAFKECVELEPSNLNHQIELGVAYYKLGKLDEALQVLDKILAVDPNHFLALNNKARILLDRSQHKEALALYRQILNQDPKHIRTWIKAAQVMLSLQKYDKADGCIQEALAVSPNDGELWRERAIIARNAQNLEKASEYIEKSLEQKATDFDSLREKANILAALKQFKKAIDAYESALRQKSSDLDVKVSLGYAYLADNRPKDALDAFEAVMKEQKNNAKVWDGRGLAFIALGENARGLVNRGTAAMIDKNYDEALKRFDAAIESTPNFPEAWSNKGVLLEKLEKYEEAADAYQHALKLDPNAIICMHNLGMLYINHLNNRTEGLSWIKNTLKYDPQRWFKLPTDLRSAVDSVPYHE